MKNNISLYIIKMTIYERWQMLDKILKNLEAFFVRIKNNFLNMNTEKKFYSIALISFILF